ncbi:MAG: M42 family metallopeptidase [Saprospiraceae bacterium]|nr:M42 family metallopeptidase [Saprospiraceae bacterium]
MIDFDLLKVICETPGAPGFEKPVRDLVIRLVKPMVDEISIDAMGNVIALKRGRESKRVMIAAHLDEISFIVTHIDDEGFIRFHTLGGFDPKTLTAQRVVIHGEKDVFGVMGCKPVHLMQAEEKNKAPNLKDYYIDTGLPSQKVKELITVGNPITRERSLIQMGDCVNGKSLDNRVSVYILIKTLEFLSDKEVPYDIYATFTVQEEVGLRGAMSSAGHINPHFGFGLDVTVAFDLPGAQPHEVVTKLGHGAAIKIMDGSTICDYRMVKYLKKQAEDHNIKWQPEILTAGGTDTAGVQRYGKDGAIAGAISIPLRHLHQVIEMAHSEDIEQCIELLTHAVLHLDEFDWQP